MYCTTKKIINGCERIEKKKTFASLDEAIERARVMNCEEKQIHKLVAYKCPECHKYHIGRSKSVLTDKDKEHYRKMGKVMALMNK